MPPFCFYCVAQFVSTKDAFSLPTHIVWQAASFTKVAGDPLISQIYTLSAATIQNVVSETPASFD
jgi:hypothetical protein